MLDLKSPAVYDKIYGCWMGKNSGGTLGTPLEQGYGQPEPFDVWWYPKLQEGGIPNDDLEMQLIWLKAIEAHGPSLRARHLAEYWLNHIGYNWDEYGWSKMNMRLGLMPPVTGSYNNWFVDCMGCPIRSEIFACIAPGLPRLAVRYAYEDAICDHAGGESVYGEMFNCSIEAAAFVVDDVSKLIDIGRSYVADGSQTAKAIDAARQAHREGLDWKAAREKVMQATPHHVAQYSPINMGFQTIGLLYGRDFAESICIAVNCGYDTDCTGATVGAILGIIHGLKGLPAKWIEPLGDTIATNESWGGLVACDVGGQPIPRTLKELTDRTIVQAMRFSAGHTVSVDDLYADESVKRLWRLPATRVTVPVGTFDVGIDYLDTPVVMPGKSKRLRTTITSSATVGLDVTCGLHVPAGWRAPMAQQAHVPAVGEVTLDWTIDVPGPELVANSNRCSLSVSAPQRVAQCDAPVVLIGARRMRISKPYGPGEDAHLLEQAFEPEQARGDDPLAGDARPGMDQLIQPLGHDLRLASVLPAGHAIYVQAFAYCDQPRNVLLAVPSTGLMKSWVNGTLQHDQKQTERFRPHGQKWRGCAELTLKPGFNELLVKLVRPAGSATFDAHLILVDPAIQFGGCVDIGWTRLPWDLD